MTVQANYWKREHWPPEEKTASYSGPDVLTVLSPSPLFVAAGIRRRAVDGGDRTLYQLHVCACARCHSCLTKAGSGAVNTDEKNRASRTWLASARQLYAEV